MKKVLKISAKSKRVRRAKAPEARSLKEYGAMELDSKVALIQELIPLGLMHIGEVLREEVKSLAGERYKRNGRPGHVRWTKQKGYVYIKDQRLPIVYQRVRDTRNNREVPLSTYERFQEPRDVDEALFRRVLHGLSCRSYRECAEAVPGALSLSPSTVSRRFVRASERKLRELMERRLDEYDFVAVVMDGKRFGDDGMIMAIGITVRGEKVVLGIIQAATENRRVCKDFLLELVERGLRYDKGLLFIIDGAKGLRRAINEVFGANGVVQRCQWHKRKNVLDYLPKGLREQFRRKLQRAYDKGRYEEARAALMAVRAELKLINISAVKSLDEGFEETLTLQRLGLHGELKRSFRTTNMIESVMSLIGQKTDKVDCWKNSNQKHRWVASALLWAEGRLNRVAGYRHLPRLREAIQREIQMRERKEAAAA
jgi:transposase-like protein